VGWNPPEEAGAPLCGGADEVGLATTVATVGAPEPDPDELPPEPDPDELPPEELAGVDGGVVTGGGVVAGVLVPADPLGLLLDV
jgi:hypothetical protein